MSYLQLDACVRTEQVQFPHLKYAVMFMLMFPDCVHMKLCNYDNTWPAHLSLKAVSICAGEQPCRPVRGWKVGSCGFHSFAQLSDTGRIQLFGAASVKCPTHPRCWQGGRSEPHADPPDCRSHISQHVWTDMTVSWNQVWTHHLPWAMQGIQDIHLSRPHRFTLELSGFIWSTSSCWSI